MFKTSLEEELSKIKIMIRLSSFSNGIQDKGKYESKDQGDLRRGRGAYVLWDYW